MEENDRQINDRSDTRDGEGGGLEMLLDEAKQPHVGVHNDRVGGRGHWGGGRPRRTRLPIQTRGTDGAGPAPKKTGPRRNVGGKNGKCHLAVRSLGGDWGAQSFPKNPRQKEIVMKNTDGRKLPYFFCIKHCHNTIFSECHKICYIVKTRFEVLFGVNYISE